MSAIDWNKIAEQAASQTDVEFNKELASLTGLKIPEIDAFIKETNITNADALKVLKEIDDATTSNNQKAQTITNIENGVGFLVKLASKVV